MKLHEEKPELDHSRTYCPTVLDETVKRRLVDVLWATKICQVLVDLAEAQNAKGQFNNRPNMTKLSQGGAISSSKILPKSPICGQRS